MDRGAWWAMVHGVAKELDMTEWLNKGNSKGVMRGSKGLGTDLSGKASSFLPLRMLAVGFCSYFSSKPFPSPGNLPNPGIELRSPTFQVNSLLFKPVGKPFASNWGNSLLFLIYWEFFFFLNINGYWIFLSFFFAGSMWHLRFVTRDQVCAPCSGSRSPCHWTVRELPGFFTWLFCHVNFCTMAFVCMLYLENISIQAGHISVLRSHMWLVATSLESEDIEYRFLVCQVYLPKAKRKFLLLMALSQNFYWLNGCLSPNCVCSRFTFPAECMKLSISYFLMFVSLMGLKWHFYFNLYFSISEVNIHCIHFSIQFSLFFQGRESYLFLLVLSIPNYRHCKIFLSVIC